MANLVAKSYQNLEQVTEPYEINGKTYVKVRLANGNLKQVRSYTEEEYKKFYGAAPVAPQTQKESYGFTGDTITIFKGDTYPHKDWFKSLGAKYCPLWGWYFATDAEIPELPSDITPITLNWSVVGNENGTLKSESIVKAEIAKLVYEPSSSKFVGEVGQRREFMLKVVRAIPIDSYYGGTIYTFEDEDKNVFIWKTSAATLTVGNTEHLKGTIKAHNIFRDVEQTVLTRCTLLSTK